MNALPRRCFGLLLALAWMTPLTSVAQSAKRPITAQDLWAIKRVGAPALSPDGKRAVVSVQEWSIEKSKPTATMLWNGRFLAPPRESRITTMMFP